MVNGSKMKDCLKWPNREDKTWIEHDDIIYKVDKPTVTAKEKRFVNKLTHTDNMKLKKF